MIQIVGPTVAIATLIWTIFTGYEQQKQLQLQQAYTKLGSQLASERASGVAELSGLLGKYGSKLDRDVLTALVNELALDSSPEIRSSILGVFENLKGIVDKFAIDAALQSTVSLQRVNIRSSHLYPFELAILTEEERGSFSYFPINGSDPPKESKAAS